MMMNKSRSLKSYARLLNRMGWALVLFWGAFQFIQIFLLLAFSDVSAGGGSAGMVILYGILSPLGYMAPFFIGGAVFYLFCRKEETAHPMLGVRLPAVFPLMVLSGLCINLAAAYLNSMMCQAIGFSLPQDEASVRFDNVGAVVQYMSVALAPAFAEEFLFRGVIYTNLRKFGRTQAVLISALAFALMHQNPAQLFYTFVCGIVLALMYEYTGSIWCSIFFHLFNNELSVLQQVLYYGKLGNGIEGLLQLWDVFLYALGFLSIGLLILYARQKKKDRPTAEGYFGSHARSGESTMCPLRIRDALHGALTPGAITFAALAVTEMILLYLMYAPGV